MLNSGERNESTRMSLTERQQYSLTHLEQACANGETIRDYAAREKLSVHSLYSMHKRHVKFGMTFSQPARQSSRVAFNRVKVTPQPSPPNRGLAPPLTERCGS